MPGPIVLHHGSIELRTIERDDVPFLQEMRHDPALWQGFGAPEPWNEAQMEAHFEEQNEGPAFLICRSGEPVGRVRLVDVDSRWRNGELTCYVKPSEQRTGVGTAACTLLIEHAFDHRNLQKILARAFDTNTTSQALLSSLGFVHEGTLREHAFHDGAYRDVLVFGLLRDEWEPR